MVTELTGREIQDCEEEVLVIEAPVHPQPQARIDTKELQHKETSIYREKIGRKEGKINWKDQRVAGTRPRPHVVELGGGE